MIRIKANKCGYQGFTCRGIPQLESHMFDTTNTFVSDMQAEFEKLPVRIKGMVYTEETIDMGWPEGGPHPEVAELTCRSDTDPESTSTDVSVNQNGIPVEIDGQTYTYPVYGGTSGWSDLFNAHYIDGSTVYFYKDNVWVGVTGVVTQYDGIEDITNIPEFIEGTTAYLSGGTEYEMRPGLLEPMLDTDFDPIGIDTIPSWEAGLDAITYNEIVINGWKGVVDDRFRNIYWRLNNLPFLSGVDENLRKLIEDENDSGPCTNFMIYLVAGSSLQSPTETQINLYDVTPGYVLVDGQSIYVSNPAAGANEFFAYVQIVKLGDGGAGKKTVSYSTTEDWAVGRVISGGTVTAKESTTDPETEVTTYTYTLTYSAFYGNNYAGILLTSKTRPEMSDDIIVVGGVKKIVTGTGRDDLILYKIFTEECVPSFSTSNDGAVNGIIKSGNPNGEVLVPIEGSTEIPYPGSLQPVANIWLNAPRSHSTTDVPTVEAVYNFIHGIKAYGGGVANALATAETIVGAVGGMVYSDTTAGSVRTVYRDRANQLPSEQQLSDLSVASSMLEAAETAWELDGEPKSGDIWEAYQEALYNYNYAYAVAYYGAAEAGEPGTVYTINCIAISNGTAIKVDGTIPVPTADAVHAYVHDVYALSTPGTVSTASTPHAASQGIPGTVFTIDALDTSAYEGGSYMDCQVPTVKAVMDYVQYMEGATAAIPAAIYGGTEYVDIEGSTEHNAGLVQSVVNIYVAGTVPTDLSDTAVPTVKAIHEYIHCTGSSAYDWSSSLATTGTMGSTVSVPATTAGVNGATATAPAIYGSTVKGAVPGTVIVVENIDLTGEKVDLDIVPTVLAVVDYIDSLIPVPGYIEVSGGKETWRQGSGDSKPLEGLVFVAVNIDAGEEGVAHEAVPTVAAVKTYVDSVTGATTAVAGKIIESGSPAKQSVADVSSGITHTVGVVQPVRNIFIGANGTVAQETVPTVDAIYNFVHDIEVSGMSFATARASIGTMGSSVSVPATTAGVNGATATAPAVYESTITDAKSGTVLVVGNIDISGSGVPANIVPTVLAVTGYIDTLVPVAGTISVAGNEESWVDASIVRKGLVYTSTNVDAGTAGVAHSAVPTVAAVKAYVDDYVPAEAVPDALNSTGKWPSGSTHSPGIVNVSTEVHPGNAASAAASAVPTVNAVAGFVSGYLAVSGELDESTGNWVSGSTNSPGIVNVATNVVLGPTNSNAASAVPTVRAVAEYVATHGGTGSAVPAVRGTLSISNNTEVVVNESSLVSHVQGIVNVLNTVQYAKNATRAVTPDAVPSVISVYNFIHSTALDDNDANFYVQALATGTAMSKSGTTVTHSGTPGTVRIATDIKIGAGTSTVPDSYRVVPTAQAVVTYVAEHGGSSPIATVNNLSTAGLVYIVDYLPVTTSHPAETVPTVDAVWSAISGGSSGTGMVRWPNYASLANLGDHETSPLSPNTTYYVTSGGWLRVTLPSSAGCGCVTIDGNCYFGLGNPGSGLMTWLLPVGPGHSFYIGTSSTITGYVIKFDGICSSSSKSAGSTQLLRKTSGITKYDPNDPESIEEPEEDIMDKYDIPDMSGTQEDLEQISQLAQEAEANKNHVITQHNTVTSHTKTFVLNSKRSTMCSTHVEDLCSEVYEYYEAAMLSKDPSEAKSLLEQGNAVKVSAYDWVGKTQAYGATMSVLHNIDMSTDYVALADDFIATAKESYEAAVRENEDLQILEITGGAQFVNIAYRAYQESMEWRTKLEEEIENNAIVYTKASSIASEAYDTAVGAYSKLEDKAQEASTYVNSLEKSQQR